MFTIRQISCHLARVSHQHSDQFGQAVLPDAEENPERRVKLTLPRDALKVDDETDGQSGRMVGEKLGLARISYKFLEKIAAWLTECASFPRNGEKCRLELPR